FDTASRGGGTKPFIGPSFSLGINGCLGRRAGPPGRAGLPGAGGGTPGPTPPIPGRGGKPARGALVGCGPRRCSPGLPYPGRDPGGPPGPVGRGRWKIGCPPTTPCGRWPGAPCIGRPEGEPWTGGAGLCTGGAVYTGRGPV